jgi:hypothetical protein
MRDKVFVRLDTRDPRFTLVGNTGLAANAQDKVVAVHAIDELPKGLGEHLGISVDLRNSLARIKRAKQPTYHETHFEKAQGNAHQLLDFPEYIEVEWRHAVAVRYSRTKVHETELTVARATVAGPLIRRSFGLSPALDDDDSRSAPTCLG